VEDEVEEAAEVAAKQLEAAAAAAAAAATATVAAAAAVVGRLSFGVKLSVGAAQHPPSGNHIAIMYRIT
jgi:hypothetical protein